MAACTVCGDPRLATRNPPRCKTCWSYWRRRGTDRPAGLVERLTERDITREAERRRRGPSY